MVDPITAGAAVVTGLKLVKQSVDFIKQNISTAQDIGDLIGHIDKAMTGEEKVEEIEEELKETKDGGLMAKETE